MKDCFAHVSVNVYLKHSFLYCLMSRALFAGTINQPGGDLMFATECCHFKSSYCDNENDVGAF